MTNQIGFKNRYFITSPTLRSAVLALCTTLGACSGAVQSDDDEPSLSGPVASASEGILNGDASSNDRVVKVVRLKVDGGAVSCTGTLLRSNIVLTARHCVGTLDDGSGNRVFTRHYIKTGDGTVFEISTREQVIEHPDVDIAVLKLDGHVSLGSAGISYYTPLYSGTVNSLKGKTVTCVGYGAKTCGGSDSGVQLKASLVVGDDSTSQHLKYVPNQQGQLLSQGDSGGPCFYNGQVVGTTHTASCSTASQIALPNYNTWIRAQMGALMNDYWTDFHNTGEIDNFAVLDMPGSTDGPSNWAIDPEALQREGALIQHSDIKNPGSMLLLKGHVLGDGSVSTWVRASDTTGSVSIVLRYQNSKNFYRLTAWDASSSNLSGIYKVKDGVSTRLVSVANPNLSTGLLSAWALGSKLTGLVGGTYVEATDSDFSDGRVGVMTNGCAEAAFDEFAKED
jgi:V8-like Glu-specific endopeptidase